MMTPGTSGAPAITSELLQTLDPGVVCSFRAQQTVCILPPKQNTAIWGELTAGWYFTGTKNIQSCYAYSITSPLSPSNLNSGEER